jgi:colicin import membrane protein
VRALRPLSFVFSVGLHAALVALALWAPEGRRVRIDLDRPVYEVSLLGAPGKAGPGAPRPKPAPAPAQEPVKAAPRPAPSPVPPEAPKPAAKEVPREVPPKALPIPAENATVAEKPKKPAEEKKEPPKQDMAKEDAAKVAASKNATNATQQAKAPAAHNATNATASKNATKSAQDVLAEALQSVRKEAGVRGGTGTGATKEGTGKEAGDALHAALAEVRGSVGSGSGRGEAGSAGDGRGEGEGGGGAGGYAQQAVAVIRPNWRFPRISSIDMVATVELTVAPSGKILAARLVQTSGRADYDASVLRAIQDTETLPPLPAGIGPKIVITFHSLE